MNTKNDYPQEKRHLLQFPSKIRIIVPEFRKTLLAAEEAEGYYLDENELLRTLIDLISSDSKAKERIEYYALQLAADYTRQVMNNVDPTIQLLLELGTILHRAMRIQGLYVNDKLNYLFYEMKNGSIIIQHNETFYRDLKHELNG